MRTADSAVRAKSVEKRTLAVISSGVVKFHKPSLATMIWFKPLHRHLRVTSASATTPTVSTPHALALTPPAMQSPTERENAAPGNSEFFR